MSLPAPTPCAGNDGDLFDLAIVGGGINGAGIAADAAGRGLKVFLCEQADFASATSSASSKLVHGGLRYLEHYEFRLVREALAEREVLLGIAPHLVRPQRFVLPHAPHLRPAWMIRAGMFLYDNLGKRTTLPASRQLQLAREPALRGVLREEFHTGFEYADCTVDDARLVIANLQSARGNGAEIHNYARCERAFVDNGCWQLDIARRDGQPVQRVRARALVNAAGPWAQKFLEENARQKSPYKVRLVQGSHIILPRLHDDARALIIQNSDRRVVFVIPWHDFTLVGTTDREYEGDPAQVKISEEETQYLLDVVNAHFRRQVKREEILGSWSGVRPLCDDESSDPSAVTRDYTLSLATGAGAPLLTVFGGKLTTYRRLALAALQQLSACFPADARLRAKAAWTHATPLPGGDLGGAAPAEFELQLQAEYPWLDTELTRRLAASYGSRARVLLGDARSMADLGPRLGHTLYAREIDYLRTQEWAVTAEDILWRRSKLAMYLSHAEQQGLATWLASSTTTGGQRDAA